MNAILKNNIMKRILLLASAIFSLTAMTAQCTADYDFGEATFGVSPDPEMGESFEVGVVGVPYVDDIHILVPTEAADIDETLPAGIPIDSLQLLSVELIMGGMTYTPEEVGLTINCNNNGDSGLSCSFLGGNQYCARLEGTPTMAGTFQLVINVLGWTDFFGPQSQEVAFDQYTLIINNDVAVSELSNFEIELGQNVPNPAATMTSIPFSVNTAGTVELSVVNLLGEVLISELVESKGGKNNVKIDVSNLDNGIYLYCLESNGKKLTKRLIINR